MKRSWPGLAPRVSAASGLTAATRIVRPSAVCPKRMRGDQTGGEEAIARIEIQLKPAEHHGRERLGTGRAMPLMPFVMSLKATSISGKTSAALSVTKPR